MLAPHPDLPRLLSRWLREGDATFRELAARVLGRRGALSAAEMDRSAADRPEIAAHVLVPMALAKHPALDEHLARALGSGHGALRRAAWVCTALRSRPRAAELLRGELDGPEGETATLLLAAVGSAADAAHLHDRALRQPSPHALAAVAVTGRVDSVDGLIDFLRHSDPALALAAARALERITGAGIIAEVEVAPEELLAPDLPEPRTGGFDGAPTLAQAVSDPRDTPAAGSADTLELPAPDYAAWQAWWLDHRRDFEPGRRCRNGQPFTPLVAWAELAGPELNPGERRLVGTELLVLTEHDVGFDVGDLVVAQERALERWRGPASLCGERPGSWPF